MNLETGVQDDEVMQDFESEQFLVGGDHSQKVKAPPTASSYGSKDCVKASSSTAISSVNEFNVLSPEQPIFQDTLIEASAGTGKTFSIENLVVRLLTETSPLLGRPLEIQEILVVTFTIAATKDLLVRIRSSLEKALAKDSSPLTKKRLELALFSFDEAKVFTIHKFCAKELAEAGLIQTTNEETTLSNTALLQVIRDFFRTESHKLHESDFETLLNHTPYDKLEEQLLKRLLNGKQINSLGSFESRSKEFMAINRNGYTKDLFIETLIRLSPSFQSVCNRQKQVKCLNEIHAFADQFFIRKELPKFKEIEWLDSFKEENRLKKPIDPTDEPFLTWLNHVREKITPLVSPLTIFANVFTGIQELLERKLETEDSYRFDDLLKRMREACHEGTFKQKIRDQYKAAIVDEFQDTDSTQWDIFKTLFLDSKKHTLTLVGDPKQAIYAFRGADVYTYLAASQAIENRYILNTNYRSEEGLILALNTLFEGKNLIDLPRSQQKRAYTPVKASPSVAPYPFKDGLRSIEVMTPEETTGDESLFFPVIAEQLISLKKQGISFGKCAILVSDRFQGDLCANFLEKAQIKSQKKRQQPLQETKGYKAILDLLEAIIHIRDESAFKKLLGGLFFELKEEDVIKPQPEIYETCLNLRQTLFERGVYPFFDQLHSKEKIEGIDQLIFALTEFELKESASPSALLKWFKQLPLLEFEQKIPPSQEAVQIITIHSSKGLEYDVVFCLGTLKKKSVKETFVPSENPHILTPVFDEKDEFFKLFLKESQAELLRLLYVAWTRAKFRLYIPYLGPQKEPSIIDLFCGEEDFLSLCKKSPHIGISFVTPKALPKYVEEGIEQVEIKPLNKPTISPGKPIVSFTSLTQNKEVVLQNNSPKNFDALNKTRHTLPAGAETGILLHHILETCPLTTDVSILKSHIEGKIANTPFATWSEAIEEICIPLWTKPFSNLCILGELNDCFREMPFLRFGHTQMTKGVIDMIFLFENKIYIIDWKSHFVGDSDEAYNDLSLEKIMSDYQLQKEIYENALKPYLALFPSISFGGTFIHFLRGGKTKQL